MQKLGPNIIKTVLKKQKPHIRNLHDFALEKPTVFPINPAGFFIIIFAAWKKCICKLCYENTSCRILQRRTRGVEKIADKTYSSAPLARANCSHQDQVGQSQKVKRRKRRRRTIGLKINSALIPNVQFPHYACVCNLQLHFLSQP